MTNCAACGWSITGDPLTCPQCDAEIPSDQPCRCEVEALDKRLSQLEAQFAQSQERSRPDGLCAPCVALIKDRMGFRPPFPRTAENWWAEELARLAPAGSWGELRAAIIDASNKVLRLTQLMEEEEKT